MNFENYFSIVHRHKPIPYGGDGTVREDGDANYGFRCLKGALERIDDVPELVRDPALRQLALAVNGPATSLLSLGCVSGPVSESGQHRYMGYFEFAYNSRSAIRDAKLYFAAYFHFDAMLARIPDLRPVSFAWEIQPGTFTERDNASGFTCSVNVNTHFAESAERARLDWEQSVGHLTAFLQQVGPPDADPIY